MNKDEKRALRRKRLMENKAWQSAVVLIILLLLIALMI